MNAPRPREATHEKRDEPDVAIARGRRPQAAREQRDAARMERLLVRVAKTFDAMAGRAQR